MKIKGLNEHDAWEGEGGSAAIEGDFAVKVTESKEGQANHPWAFLRFEIIRGEHTGRELTDVLTFSPKAMGRVRQAFDAFGIPVSSDIDTKDGAVYLGKKALLIVRIEKEEDNRPEYAGVMRDRSKVKAYAPLPKAGAADELADGLTERLGATPAADDDDIPF